MIRSKDSNFKESDIVVSPFSPVAEYCVTPSVFLRKIDPTNGISLPDYLSSLGGFLFKVCFILFLIEYGKDPSSPFAEEVLSTL